MQVFAGIHLDDIAVMFRTPRGCAMSPIRIPFQPVASAASGAKRFKNCTSSGWPQLRLRDTRITCQVGPVVGQFDPPLKTTARVVADCHGSAEAWHVRGCIIGGKICFTNSRAAS